MNEGMKFIVLLLNEILSNSHDRTETIKRFQKLVKGENAGVEDKVLLERLRDLAYDLYYYEPDEQLIEYPCYGEGKLKEEITSVLKAIREKGYCL